MDLGELRTRGLVDLLDVELARSLSRAGGAADPAIALAVALASRQVRRGHTCFVLSTRANELWPHESPLPAILPDRDRWRETLVESPLTREGPLVLDEKGRLYLRRYWELERDIAESLAARSSARHDPESDSTWLNAALDRLFPGKAASLQRRAARTALEHRISLLCGGPGTGKTTTVAAIVALLAERHLRRAETPPRVMLLAPTGKAAARLGESVIRAKQGMKAPEEVLRCIPDEAATVHRKLGMRREGMGFRRHAGLPLDADIVVLDEASMIDLAMMRQLLDATPDDATLLIVGDPDQLTSVEAGSVLWDLVQASRETWWRDRVTELTKTWRYDEAQPLGQLVGAIRDSDAKKVTALLSDGGTEDLTWMPPEQLPAELDRAAARWSDALRVTDAAAHFELRHAYVVLTPFRRGRIGTRRLGQLLRDRLAAGGDEPSIVPIIIEQNSQELRVFNGDFAMLALGETPTATVLGEADGPRDIVEARLPRYSDAYALTIHKSQGSEFDEVLIVLPEEDSPLLTRELLYTAVSRAKGRVRLVGPKEVVLASLGRRARRDSGLVDAIAKLEDRG